MRIQKPPTCALRALLSRSSARTGIGDGRPRRALNRDTFRLSRLNPVASILSSNLDEFGHALAGDNVDDRLVDGQGQVASLYVRVGVKLQEQGRLVVREELRVDREVEGGGPGADAVPSDCGRAYRGITVASALVVPFVCHHTRLVEQWCETHGTRTSGTPA